MVRRPRWTSGRCSLHVDLPQSGRSRRFHVLSDAEALPLVAGVSAANIADIEAFKPRSWPSRRSAPRCGPRRRPAKADAGKVTFTLSRFHPGKAGHELAAVRRL